jgi:hypothetical protein
MKRMLIGFLLALAFPILCAADSTGVKLDTSSSALADTLPKARLDTLLLSLADTLSKDDSIFWVGMPGEIPKYFNRGEVQVDVISAHGEIVTMRDTSFQIFRLGSERAEVLISIYKLIDRYFAEKAVKEGSTTPKLAGPESVVKLKREGMRWRLIALNPKPK